MSADCFFFCNFENGFFKRMEILNACITVSVEFAGVFLCTVFVSRLCSAKYAKIGINSDCVIRMRSKVAAYIKIQGLIF